MSLTDSELNWHTHNKEAYAFISTLRKFWQYLLGCCFIWHTGQMGLQWLRIAHDPWGGYAHWLEESKNLILLSGIDQVPQSPCGCVVVPYTCHPLIVLWWPVKSPRIPKLSEIWSCVRNPHQWLEKRYTRKNVNNPAVHNCPRTRHWQEAYLGSTSSSQWNHWETRLNHWRNVAENNRPMWR